MTELQDALDEDTREELLEAIKTRERDGTKYGDQL